MGLERVLSLHRTCGVEITRDARGPRTAVRAIVFELRDLGEDRVEPRDHLGGRCRPRGGVARKQTAEQIADDSWYRAVDGTKVRHTARGDQSQRIGDRAAGERMAARD